MDERNMRRRCHGAAPAADPEHRGDRPGSGIIAKTPISPPGPPPRAGLVFVARARLPRWCDDRMPKHRMVVSRPGPGRFERGIDRPGRGLAVNCPGSGAGGSVRAASSFFRPATYEAPGSHRRPRRGRLALPRARATMDSDDSPIQADDTCFQGSP
jgi:hypothetical protein